MTKEYVKALDLSVKLVADHDTVYDEFLEDSEGDGATSGDPIES